MILTVAILLVLVSTGETDLSWGSKTTACEHIMQEEMTNEDETKQTSEKEQEEWVSQMWLCFSYTQDYSPRKS